MKCQVEQAHSKPKCEWSKSAGKCTWDSLPACQQVIDTIDMPAQFVHNQYASTEWTQSRCPTPAPAPAPAPAFAAPAPAHEASIHRVICQPGYAKRAAPGHKRSTGLCAVTANDQQRLVH
eukprot:scaffold172284_cov18-Tisochrysis_lutea.AAC.1